jgi:hypothetical protein
MVTDPALFQQAIDVGLVQDPIGQEWTGYCSHEGNVEVPPCTVEVPGGRAVMIDMVEVNGDWLISAISP